MGRSVERAVYPQLSQMIRRARIALGILAAAVCAGMIVGLIPPSAPAAAAVPVQSAQARAPSLAAVEIAAPSIAALPQRDCVRAWPYYERSCLRDGRQPNGQARVVRLIPIDASSVSPTRHQRTSKPR